jgi:hypothetical protein
MNSSLFSFVQVAITCDLGRNSFIHAPSVFIPKIERERFTSIQKASLSLVAFSDCSHTVDALWFNVQTESDYKTICHIWYFVFHVALTHFFIVVTDLKQWKCPEPLWTFEKLFQYIV